MDVSCVNSPVPLYLSDNPIRFEPLGGATSVAVYFDDANRQVFTVRSNGAAGVNVKGPNSKTNLNFRLDDRGEITFMRFSNDMKILAIQRSPRSVDFINFLAGGDTFEYSQTCKGKGTKIVGFCWTGPCEIVYITDHGLEQYQVVLEKKMLKLLKTITISLNWFVWSAESSVLLLSSGTIGNTIQPISVKQGVLTKLQKFDMEKMIEPALGQRGLEQRDVTMAIIYDQLYAIQLPPQVSQSSRNSVSNDVILYQIKDSAVKKSDVLRVNITGRLTVSLLDNIVVVHLAASKVSLMFDIQLSCEVVEGVNFHRPFTTPQAVSSYKFISPAVPMPGGAETQQLNCDLYSPSCVVFQPDVVLDAKLGCFWYLRLKLEPLLSLVDDKCRLMDLLLMRRESKAVVLSLCTEVLSRQHQSSLIVVSSIFNKLNRIYYGHMEAQHVLGYESGSRQDIVSSLVKYCPVIDQSDLYTNVFSKFDQNKGVSYKFIVGVLIEYIRSLSFYQIPVQHYLYELIITTLVQHSCFYQLHQFLQYHVLSDSKHLACALLSLEGAYPPAYQLALDMLKRLQTANESIIEVLLSKKQLLAALRFIQSVGLSEQISARKFLEAARSTDSAMIFYTVYRFFEQRNLKMRNSVKFVTSDRCDQYVKHFHELFPETLSA